jgi:hypothetical protein
MHDNPNRRTPRPRRDPWPEGRARGSRRSRRYLIPDRDSWAPPGWLLLALGAAFLLLALITDILR